MIEFGHATHAGLSRGHNEDTYWADADAGLFLVVDGMGGPGRGEFAAATARDALVDAAHAGRDLAPALRDAALAIAASARTVPGVAPMGATLAALQLDATRYRAFTVGDSQVALWQHGRLTRIDQDAPPAESAPDDATAQPPPPAPRHNRATQALGITPPDELCTAPGTGPLEHGMQFLLCSDGLSEAVPDTTIARLLARTDLAAQECVDQLLLAALDTGGPDNVTTLLVRIA